jgi:hypothetical protein
MPKRCGVVAFALTVALLVVPASTAAGGGTPPRQSELTAFRETFEDADLFAATWVTDESAPPWQLTREASRHGSFSLTESPRAPYADNVSTWVRTARPISLRGRIGCVVQYALLLAVPASGDSFVVETSPDRVRWTVRQTISRSTRGLFATERGDLDSDGRKVYLRLRFTSDAAGTADGAHVDDLRVNCTRPRPSGAPGAPAPSPTPEPVSGGGEDDGVPPARLHVHCAHGDSSPMVSVRCRTAPRRYVTRVGIRVKRGRRTIATGSGRPDPRGRFRIRVARRLAHGHLGIVVTVRLRNGVSRTLTRRWG